RHLGPGGLVRIGHALVKSLQCHPNTLYSEAVLAYRESAKSNRYLSNSTRAGIDTNDIEPGNARHGFWRIGFSGTKRGASAGQARIPDQGGGAAAGTGRAPAAARPGWPDPRRAGQSALSGFGRGGDARFSRRDQLG